MSNAVHSYLRELAVTFIAFVSNRFNEKSLLLLPMFVKISCMGKPQSRTGEDRVQLPGLFYIF